MSTRIIPISDLRRRAKDVIDAVQQEQNAVYVTQHGRPVVVLVDYGEYERLLGRLEDLSNPPPQREQVEERGTLLREQPQQYATGEQTNIDLGLALSLVRQLSPLAQAQLIEQIAPDLQRALQSAPPVGRKSLRGLWRGLDITEQEIADARREMWGNFPREDLS
jgi:prevent-host-death family protein